MRNRVALGNTKLSGAKNMIQLKWDEELANIAYKHSQTCDFHHNPERPHGVGENIAQRNISKDGKDTKLLLDYVDMMTMWYNEIDNYNENGNHTGVVDSFTRMIWANTQYVGCGLTYYEDFEREPNKPYHSFLVCDYYPTGNIEGEDIYTKHDGTDKCEYEVGVISKHYAGLCAHDTIHARLGDTCSSQESKPFTCKEIVDSLKYHNKMRNKVALGKTKLKGAKNMWQLKWDKEIADVSLKHSQKCEFKHNPNRPDDVGENVAFKANSAKDAESLFDYVSMMKLWYNEINDYDENGNHKGVVGHFTQLVWGSTMYIGCGMTFYEDPNNQKYPYHSLLVCNYKPAGNYKDEKLYDEYDGPDKCDKGVLSQKYQGLCAHDAEHAKLGDTCSSSQGLKESVVVILISSAIVWYSIL
nr:ancylostoma secreted protein-like isoform X3 [Halyomorpha halys]